MSGEIPIRCVVWVPAKRAAKTLRRLREHATRLGGDLQPAAELAPLSSAPVNPAEECGPFRRDLALVSGKEPADGTPFPSRLQN